MVSSFWQDLIGNLGLTAGSAKKRVVRDGRRWGFASERLEDRALLSAAPAAAEIAQANSSVDTGDVEPGEDTAALTRKGAKSNAGKKQAKAALPDVSGDWLLTGIAVSGAFNDAPLTVTQTGKTGKNIAGSATFTGGSFNFTGKLRPNGHMVGKAAIQLGENTLTKQRYFLDFTDDFLTFSGEVNLKSLDDLMNIDGVRAV